MRKAMNTYAVSKDKMRELFARARKTAVEAGEYTQHDGTDVYTFTFYCGDKATVWNYDGGYVIMRVEFTTSRPDIQYEMGAEARDGEYIPQIGA